MADFDCDGITDATEYAENSFNDDPSDLALPGPVAPLDTDTDGVVNNCDTCTDPDTDNFGNPGLDISGWLIQGLNRRQVIGIK